MSVPNGPQKQIFVSHANVDALLANELSAALEQRELRTWIAPRDIPVGADYSESLVQGIDESAAMVVIVTPTALESRHVRSEVSRAMDKGLTLLPIRVDGVEISGGLSFFLELAQWVDLSTDTAETDLPLIADNFAAAMTGAVPRQMATAPKDTSQRRQKKREKSKPRIRFWMIMVGIILLLQLWRIVFE
ncbi:MAG: toll/interleukin-1 receptor domain-containing protein [Pikeienuella sp.]